jgi:ribosomal protein S18 acetylase RimI-like enzyme
MIEIRPATVLGEDAGSEIARVFVDGFGEHFRFFSKDPAVLSAAFTHMFSIDRFYVALSDGEVAGIAACADRVGVTLVPRADELRKHLGAIKGTFAHRAFLGEFVTRNPIQLDSQTASIEFVATSAAHRRQGVARALIEHIIMTTPFESFVVEVADTNPGAIRLYEERGFREFSRVPESRFRASISGVNALVYMKHTKSLKGTGRDPIRWTG